MSFVSPPPFGKVGDYSNLSSHAINSVMDISWTGAPSPYANLWLLKDGNGYTCKDLNLAFVFCEKILSFFSSDETSYSWAVSTYDSNSTSAAPFFYLQIRPSNDSSTTTFTSHYFNILSADQISSSRSTISSTSSTSTTSSSASTASATSVLSSPTPTSSLATSFHTSSPSPGLSTETKAAIGVSIGVGIPLVIILAFIAFFLHRRYSHNRNNRQHTFHDGPIVATTDHRYTDKGSAYNAPTTRIQELHGEQQHRYLNRKHVVAELSGVDVGRQG